MILIKKITLIALLIFAFPLFSQEPKQSFGFEVKKPTLTDYSINNRQSQKKEEDLRKEWQEFLGLDIFYPYYKAKKAESWFSDRLQVEIFNLTGRPQLEKNQAAYNFKVEF